MAQFALSGLIRIKGSKAAVKAIKFVNQSVGGLQSKAQALGRGFSDINRGLLAVGAAGTAAGAGLGFAISKAGSFQQQITRVSALTGQAEKTFGTFEAAALKAGSQTQFTSVAAGKALEFLTLAGFEAADSVKVLPIILDTATAGALDLGRASDIVTDSMSSLTLAFDKKETTVQRATRLADIFAKVQAKSNTNIEQLGEAVTFGGGSLAAMKIPLEQIIAAMGKLADAGLKGSMGGTNLAQAFEKLVKPSRAVNSTMKTLGVNMDNLPIQDLPRLINLLAGTLNKIEDPNKKAALATELFGVRGKRAFNALLAAGGQALGKLTKELKNSAGFAKQIAEVQRRTFEGQRKNLVSAIEGSLIGLGNFFIKGNATFLQIFSSLVKGVQDIAIAFQMASVSGDKLNEAMASLTPRQRKILEFSKNFKVGVEEAFTTAKSVFAFVKNTLVDLFPSLRNNSGEIGRLVGKFTVLAALIAPLATGFVALTLGAGALFIGIGGLFTVFKVFGGISFSLLKTILVLDGKIIGLALKTIPLLKVGFIKLGAVFAANPIGLTIAAIAGAIAIGILLFKNWNFITQNIQRLWTQLMNFFKNASLGEIILKTLLFPIRAAFTPILEIVRALSGSSFGKKILGNKADFVKSFADKLSLFSDQESEKPSRQNIRGVTPSTNVNGSVQWVPPQQQTFNTSRLVERALDKQRLSAPAVSDRPVSVNVAQPSIEANFNIAVEMDSEVIDRKLVKRSIGNSERLGQNLSPKTRQRSINGSFAKTAG